MISFRITWGRETDAITVRDDEWSISLTSHLEEVYDSASYADLRPVKTFALNRRRGGQTHRVVCRDDGYKGPVIELIVKPLSINIRHIFTRRMVSC